MSKYKDLTDQRFGMLTALAKVPNANAKQAVWHCRCDCGNECDVKKTQLERGSVQDCGCVSNKRFAESDLTGKRFGNLMVVERLTEKNYRCVCDCGNEKAVLASSLLSGKTTSCGCMRGKRRRQDITGMRSGMVVAIEPTDIVRRSSILWRCRCDCGKEVLTEAYKISSGKIQSCGCQRGVHNIKDLTGQRFGKLTCLELYEGKDKRGNTQWVCQCDCGNTCVAAVPQLKSGYKKSCGCLSHPPLKDYIGKKFGKLTVVEYAGKRAGMHRWKCICECGNETIVGQTLLQTGKTKSCGCLTRLPKKDISENIFYKGFLEGTNIGMLEARMTKPQIATNTSGYNGVYNARGLWRAQITFKKKTYYLGSYSDI